MMYWYIGNEYTYAIIPAETRYAAVAIAADGKLEATEVREATQQEVDEYFDA